MSKKVNIELTSSEARTRPLRSGDMVVRLDDVMVSEIVYEAGVKNLIDEIGAEDVVTSLGSDSIIQILTDFDVDIAGKVGIDAFLERFSIKTILDRIEMADIIEYIDSKKQV